MIRLRKVAASIGIAFVFFTQTLLVSSASAATVSGLNVEVYTYDPSFTPERIPYTPCVGAWTHVDNIDSDYDNQYGGVVAGCQQEFVLMHYTGSVTFPESGEYSFQALADDGFWMSLDGVPVIAGDWVLKGRSGGLYSGVQIEGGHTYVFDAWFYEYGGGANATLYYAAPNKAFEVVPTEFFTTDGSTPVVVTPAFLNAPTNVKAVADGTSLKVTWDTPVDSGTAIERYALTWTYDGQPGWGVGVFGNEFTITGLPENKDVTVWLRSDNDTLMIYSGDSEKVTVATEATIVVPPEPPVPPVDPPVVDPPTGPVVEPPLPPKTPEVKPLPVPEPPKPPLVEIPTPVEPSVPPIASVDPSTINPQELTATEVTQLTETAHETLATEPEGSPAYETALEQLYVAAQADDIVVSEELASVPVLGAAVVGLTNAINALGNLGSDMSPAHREKAKKEIVAAVVATGAAVNAVAASAGAAGASSGSTSSSRKKE